MSRFVSAGTNEQPIERDSEWLKAQEEIEAARRRKAEAQEQNEGKSLYETLQANKAAKQEAFEESIRLKNQFRSLDDDEVEFLDSVLESTRAKEDAVRKETSQQLEAFRKQREEAERAAKLNEDGTQDIREAENWAAGRKRKKGKERELSGIKLRKKSSIATEQLPQKAEDGGEKTSPKDDEVVSKVSGTSSEVKQQGDPPKATTSPSVPQTTGGGLLGLGDYSSDDD